MKPYLPLLAVCAWIALGDQAALAQMQGGAPTLGTCVTCGKAPKETATQKRKKTAACNAAVKQKGLTGKDRTAYLKLCNNTLYSDPFTPPDWPQK